MGREVKRVALDFAWPLETVWEGYINPHHRKCESCDGTGATVARHRLEGLVGLLMLSGEDAAKGCCHPYFQHMPGLWRSAGKAPSPDMVELTAALAGRPPRGLGHDACDAWAAHRKILAAAGLPETWGTCPHCGGEGLAPEARAAYEAWEDYEPPEGEGWQVWETVSEGSPISPAFATPEELARHMAATRWGADKGTSYETWLAFIRGPGWAPSMVGTSGQWMNGVEGVVALGEKGAD